MANFNIGTRSARRLLPWRDYDEHDVINIYALQGTGLAGGLVKINQCAPSNDYFYSSTAVGASFNGITSNRWINPFNVVLAGSGDGRYNGVLGLTLVNVQEYDENGNRLVTLGQQYKYDENNAVASGFTVPILTRGIVAINYTVYSGSTFAPSGGYVATVSYQASTANGGFGQIDCVPKANIVAYTSTNAVPGSGLYSEDAVIGNFLSSSGTERNGWALLKLRL